MIILILSARPELANCLVRLMPAPPGWNWKMASGLSERVRASSTEKSACSSLV
ncbi:hypothetical protein D3C81_2317640 [compost metagenome]